MSVTDPIADMLTVIRNGSRAHKEDVMVKGANTNEEILEVLKREGFISNYKKIADKKQGVIKVYLKYEKDTPFLTGIKRVSKPGRRVYVGTEDIKAVYGGIGVALLFTSKGIMTDKEAKEKRLGGEMICEVW